MIFYPIIIGIFSGLVYWLFFVLAQKRAFSLLFAAFAALRIILISVIWYYLLPWSPINFILVMISFSITFWLLLLRNLK